MRSKHAKKAESLDLDDLVQSNVDAITRIEETALSSRTRGDRVADAIAGFCGRMAFVYVHGALFLGWLVWNGSRWVPNALKFDRPPFNSLALALALEAIFLSTFILISQNRVRRLDDQRNHLDLQINMLAEQESSEMLAMMRHVVEHLGLHQARPKRKGLEKETDLERVADQLQRTLDPNQEGQTKTAE